MYLPNVPSGFFKWRDIPKVLFALKGQGVLRWENSDGTKILHDYQSKILLTTHVKDQKLYYLSRIQPWCRWHISLQWPLFFNCHYIFRSEDVVLYPTYQSAFGITKMITFGIGFKRDGDKVYWLTMNAGGNFE